MNLGSNCCRALPFHYAFSGCDTTSSFYKIGKCKWFDGWVKSENKESYTSAFFALTDNPSQEDNYIDDIERYVKDIYYPGKALLTDLAEERMMQFYNIIYL